MTRSCLMVANDKVMSSTRVSQMHFTCRETAWSGAVGQLRSSRRPRQQLLQRPNTQLYSDQSPVIIIIIIRHNSILTPSSPTVTLVPSSHARVNAFILKFHVSHLLQRCCNKFAWAGSSGAHYMDAFDVTHPWKTPDSNPARQKTFFYLASVFLYGTVFLKPLIKFNLLINFLHANIR